VVEKGETLFAGAAADIQDFYPGLEFEHIQHPGVNVIGAVAAVDVDPFRKVIGSFLKINLHGFLNV
jgi:hypothetical protein